MLYVACVYAHVGENDEAARDEEWKGKVLFPDIR